MSKIKWFYYFFLHRLLIIAGIQVLVVMVVWASLLIFERVCGRDINKDIDMIERFPDNLR